MSHTSKGTIAASRVKHVEDAECPGLPVGPHELTNLGLVTLCRWCDAEWGILDAALRGTP